MRKLNLILWSFFVVATIIGPGCQKELQVDHIVQVPNLGNIEFDYALPWKMVLSSEFPISINYLGLDPKSNQVTNAAATLGRVLFYDKKLSINNSTSCSSCHIQKFAFSDGLKFSKGFNGEQTSRNTPALINIIAQKSFLWDGRESSLEEMVLLPIKSHVEMGISKIENLPFKIANISYYPDLFEKAFGQREVTNEKIARALSQFLRSMVTHNTEFDNEYFSPEEKNGKALFFWKDAGCNNCHRGENLNQKGNPVGATIQSSFANIGLDEVYADQGLGELDFINNGVFKIPSLRNIALTAPYMHDGRFSTLEEVVEHYNSGVKNHPNLDPLLKTGSGAAAVPQRLNLSKKEKSDLVAFLKTLTDPKITTDVRFSDPFIR